LSQGIRRAWKAAIRCGTTAGRETMKPRAGLTFRDKWSVLCLVLIGISGASGQEPPRTIIKADRLSEENKRRIEEAGRLLEESKQFFGQGQYREASEKYRRLLVIYKELFDEHHVMYAMGLAIQANNLRHAGYYLEAKSHYEQALPLLSKAVGRHDAQY